MFHTILLVTEHLEESIGLVKASCPNRNSYPIRYDTA